MPRFAEDDRGGLDTGDDEREAMLDRLGLESGDRAYHEIAEVDRRAIEREMARFELGEVKKLVDEVEQVRGLRVRGVVEHGRFAHRGAWGGLSRTDQEAVSQAMAQTGLT
ncbi:MAG: hypothetical protein AAGN64_15225, partial [Bacteroidota bacterium]